MMEPQAVDGAFEATRTILAPMPTLGIPEVLADEGRGLWSVRQPGVEVPRVYRCADNPLVPGLRGRGRAAARPGGPAGHRRDLHEPDGGLAREHGAPG